MSKIKNGDRLIHSFSGSDLKNLGGLTKREYFAGLAMQGIINSSGDSVPCRLKTAKFSVEYADELLKQLENTK